MSESEIQDPAYRSAHAGYWIAACARMQGAWAAGTAMRCRFGGSAKRRLDVKIHPHIKGRMIHVCSLARLHDTVDATGARHVVTLLKDIDRVERPRNIVPANHLLLGMDDITVPMDGYTIPCDEHVSALITFVRGWDRAKPLVVHCYAGISRSTAGAYVAACALNPHRDEWAIARELRRVSPTATPNSRLVALADRMLCRDGRMVAAIDAIGRGAIAYEADPFWLELE